MNAHPYRTRAEKPGRFFGLVAVGIALPGLLATAARAEVFPAHDPCLIRAGGTYYLFATGRGLPVRTSPDLIHWSAPTARVFDAAPAWAAKDYPKAGDYFWAPDISFSNGEYRLYYAVSTFGTSESTIGLATTPTLDTASPDYKWTDRGPVVTTHKTSGWNAIDPAAFTDAGGQTWLAAGSYWTGIKLFKLDAAGKIVAGDPARAIAARPDNAGVIEAPFLTHRGEWYYLWVSFDRCCAGVKSTYNTRVGRSRSVEGPFLDQTGKPMIEGGGTVVLTSAGDERGPGHCAVLHEGDTDYLVHHWYDAAHRGRATLGVRKIAWDADGWPHAEALLPTTQPATRPATQPATLP